LSGLFLSDIPYQLSASFPITYHLPPTTYPLFAPFAVIALFFDGATGRFGCNQTDCLRAAVRWQSAQLTSVCKEHVGVHNTSSGC